MNKRVNFDDNFFILTMRIRMIQDTVILDADPELFLEKTLDDIYFIDNTLRGLLEYLENNLQLCEREAHFEQFSNVDSNFSQVLGQLIHNSGSFSIRDIPTMEAKLAMLKNSSLDRQTRAGKQCSSDGESGASVVSSIELSELLKAF
jgi:hypothetical protein